MNDEFAIIRDQFLAALERDSLEEQLKYAEEHCGDTPELRDKLVEMIQAHHQSEGFLASKIEATELTAVTELPGDTIGPYKLLQQIGEGGMGVVYMAEQTHPVERRVALKIIKPGMDTRQVIARFEAERQALAMMDHPNIAKVLDTGTTDSGRPYFVMELVKGMPVTQYCDEQHLTPRERLELFVPICQAVQHAHQKGIIHRDLKPTNILIAQYDDKPVPKVIDFGVAKAVSHNLTEKTMFTQYGQIVGTIEYMSPEQARFNQLDVDTRSDIYSLGVLLYELLSGETPFDKKRFRTAAFDELLRIIREEEPPRMSTRLSSSETLATTAINRKTEPKKLSLLVRGELDWIVMKALEKDRNRRYETANGFAADVLRYLADEAVQACPPSAGYRFRKFARRNKGRLVTTSLLSIALLTAVGGVGWALRDRTAYAQAAANQRVLTEAEIRQALGRGTKIRAELHSILKKSGGVQLLLNQPARWELLIKTAQGELSQARRIVVRAGGSLATEWTPAVNQLEDQLSSDQADYDLASRLETIRLERVPTAVGFDYRRSADEYAEAFAGFAVLHDATPKVATRIASSPIRDQLIAALDDWVLTAVLLKNQRLGEQLLDVARRAAPDPAWGDRLRQITVWRDQEALGKLVEQSPVTGLSPHQLHLVGSLLREANHPLTETWLRQAQAEYPADFWLNFNLAAVMAKSNPVEAAGFYRVALAVRPGNVPVYNNLAICLHDQQKLPEAIAIYQKAIVLSPASARIYDNLSVSLCSLQKFPEAIAASQKAIELDQGYARSHFNLALALMGQNDVDEAIAAYRKSIEFDPTFAPAHCGLGAALIRCEKFDEAICSYRESIKLDPNYALAHFNLGCALRIAEDLSGAIAAYHKALELDTTNALFYYNLGIALRDSGDLAGAIAAYHKALELDPRNAAICFYELGLALRDSGDLTGAISAHRKTIEHDPGFTSSYSNLGDTLILQAWNLVSLSEPQFRNPREAVRLGKEAVELTPHSAWNWQLLGWVQYRAGNWKASVEALEKSCRLQEGGTGDCCQWIVMALAHGQLAREVDLTEHDRAEHLTEARRLYSEAVKQFDRWGPGGNVYMQAAHVFREEAEELLKVNQQNKE